MPLSESALKKLFKNELIALSLEYQNFDSTLTNVNKYLTSGKIMRKCSQNFASRDKSCQNWGSKLFRWNNMVGVTVNTPDWKV